MTSVMAAHLVPQANAASPAGPATASDDRGEFTAELDRTARQVQDRGHARNGAAGGAESTADATSTAESGDDSGNGIDCWTQGGSVPAVGTPVQAPPTPVPSSAVPLEGRPQGDGVAAVAGTPALSALLETPAPMHAAALGLANDAPVPGQPQPTIPANAHADGAPGLTGAAEALATAPATPRVPPTPSADGTATANTADALTRGLPTEAEGSAATPAVPAVPGRETAATPATPATPAVPSGGDNAATPAVANPGGAATPAVPARRGATVAVDEPSTGPDSTNAVDSRTQAPAPVHAGTSSAATAPAPASAAGQAPGLHQLEVPVAQQLSAHLTHFRGRSDGSYETTLRLRPEELGDVTIRLQVHGGTVSLHAIGMSAAAVDILRDAMPDLRQDLLLSGLDLVDSQVDQHPGSFDGDAPQERDSLGVDERRSTAAPLVAVPSNSNRAEDPVRFMEGGRFDVRV